MIILSFLVEMAEGRRPNGQSGGTFSNWGQGFRNGQLPESNRIELESALEKFKMDGSRMGKIKV